MCTKTSAAIWAFSSAVAAGMSLVGDVATGLLTAGVIATGGLLTAAGCLYAKFSREARGVSALTDQQLLDLISKNEICVLYQPICDTKTGKMVAVEAFTRLCSRDKIVADSLYADAYTLSKVSSETRQLLLHSVFELIAEDAALLEGLELHVNISAVDLTEQSSILILTNFTKRSKITPSRIVVDLQTCEMTSDFTNMMKVAAGLSSLGFNLSLDSYSQATKSLSEFTGFPISGVKLGRDVLDRIKENKAVIGMTKMIIRSARRDGLLVTAKQVETTEEKMLVTDLNFDLLQGQIVSPPITAEEITRLRSS